MFYWIISSPFISFFIMLVWAALFGDTIVIYQEKNMIEEYLIINQVYIALVLLIYLKKWVTPNPSKE